VTRAAMDTAHGPRPVPSRHAAFLEAALPRLQADERVVAVAAGGSLSTGGMDEWSDLDLVVAVEPGAAAEVMPDRRRIAARLGPLLAAFTGEHVGEPRILICLYGPPLLHVDLKFVPLPEAAARTEDPLILWERDGRLSAVLRATPAAPLVPDLQWIEDRFWVWVHYVATKIGRGELLETLDALAFLRRQVLGPLALHAEGALPVGVRKVETRARPYLDALVRTTAGYDPRACAGALRAAVTLYRALRARVAPATLTPHAEAEAAALGYLATVEAALAALNPPA